MTLQLVLVAALGLASSGCTRGPWREPLQPMPPAQGPGDCETSTENLRQLKCDVNLEDFHAGCLRATRVEADDHVRFPSACITAAPNCDAAFACN